MARRFKVVVAGMLHESNTFASTIADRQRFIEGSLASGLEAVPIWNAAHHELGGFIEGATTHNFEMIPSITAWAMPSGPVTDAMLDEVVEQIIADCQASQADGLLLALHGAMVTPLHFSGDTEVLRRLRRELGTALPIALTLDFHANCTPEMASLASIIVGYQTYPHIDQRQVGLKAAELLARTLQGEIHPVCHIAKRPMIANILGQATDREPMKSLMLAARQQERQPGVLSASVMGGFYYADVPDMGPSVIAVADGDRNLARTTAESLADQMWEVRRELFVPCVNPAEAVRLAMGEPHGPVILVDLGDNIGGGSAGDATTLLRELLNQKARQAIVVMFAPEVVKECERLGIGKAFAGVIGGALDRLHGDPVAVAGTIVSIHPGDWIETEPRHGGRRLNNQGSTVVLQMGGESTLVLNSLQTPPYSLGQLTSLGLDPLQSKMIVVKAAVAYKAAYAPIASRIIEVDTPGVTAVNPAHFEYRQIPRPMYPLDGD